MWPKIMIIRGASEVAKWLNTFPPSGGISTTYSPRAIIIGRPVDYDKHCKIRFGSYVQASTENQPTNTPKERTIDGIHLRTLDNIQGGYEVLNLKTGKPITRHHAIELPTPPEVIKRVEQLAANEGFKPHAEPIFKTYALLAGVDDNNDTDNNTDSEDEDEPPEGIPRLTVDYDSDSDSDSDDEDEEEEDEDEEEVMTWTPGVAGNSNNEELEDSQSIVSEHDNNQEADPDDMDEVPRDDEPIPEQPRRSTRTKEKPKRLEPKFVGQVYDEVCHLITQKYPEETLECTYEEAEILALAFVQTCDLAKGIKMFGNRAEEAAFTELKQLHDRTAYTPIDINTLDAQAR